MKCYQSDMIDCPATQESSMSDKQTSMHLCNMCSIYHAVRGDNKRIHEFKGCNGCDKKNEFWDLGKCKECSNLMYLVDLLPVEFDSVSILRECKYDSGIVCRSNDDLCCSCTVKLNYDDEVNQASKYKQELSCYQSDNIMCPIRSEPEYANKTVTEHACKHCNVYEVLRMYKKPLACRDCSKKFTRWVDGKCKDCSEGKAILSRIIPDIDLGVTGVCRNDGSLVCVDSGIPCIDCNVAKMTADCYQFRKKCPFSEAGSKDNTTTIDDCEKCNIYHELMEHRNTSDTCKHCGSSLNEMWMDGMCLDCVEARNLLKGVTPTKIAEKLITDYVDVSDTVEDKKTEETPPASKVSLSENITDMLMQLVDYTNILAVSHMKTPIYNEEIVAGAIQGAAKRTAELIVELVEGADK